MTALFTAQTKIHAGAKHKKSVASAGMIFLHNKPIADANIHFDPSRKVLLLIALRQTA